MSEFIKEIGSELRKIKVDTEIFIGRHRYPQKYRKSGYRISEDQMHNFFSNPEVKGDLAFNPQKIIRTKTNLFL